MNCTGNGIVIELDQAVEEAAAQTAEKIGIKYYMIDYEAPATINFDSEQAKELSDDQLVTFAAFERKVSGSESDDVLDDFERRMIASGVPHANGVTAAVICDVAPDETLKEFAKRVIASYANQNELESL